MYFAYEIMNNGWISNLESPTINIRSHDTISLQWNRIVDNFSTPEIRPAREHGRNLWSFLTSPMMFFVDAYKSPLPYGIIGSKICTVGAWLLMIIAAIHSRAKVLFATLASLALLSFVAKDMHHLAMVLPWLALGVGEALSKQKTKLQIK